MTARPPSETTTSRAASVALPAFFAAATVACGSGDTAPAVTLRDSAGVAIITSTAPVWGPDEGWTVSPEPVMSIGALDGPPEAQLFRVMNAARLDDGRVVVANRGTREVRVYGPDGAWIRSIGGRGDGPGEFQYIRGIQLLPPDTILVRDDRGPRVTVLSVAGEVLGTRPLASPGRPYTPPDHRLPDGRWLILNRGDEAEGYQVRRNTVLVWTEGDDVARDTLLARDGQQYLIYRRFRGEQYLGSGAVVVPFGGRDLFAIGPGRVALSDGTAYDIAVAALDRPRELRVRKTVERRAVTDDDVAQFVDDYVGRYSSERQPEVREHFDEVPTPDLMPTHTTLAFDATGNLWVEAYRPPGREADPRTWSVFDPEGRWLRDVVLPEGLRVLEIGEDYVLGLERDELDVEYVKVYGLEMPAG